MKRKVIVIGAGPAGMMAAGKAAERGLQVLLLEKNERPGRKLLISGKGRCNITNAADMEDLIANIPGNGSFLYSSFYNFSNFDLVDFFNQRGLKTKIERGNRIFPVSDSSKDVVDTLIDYVKGNGARVLYKTPVRNIEIREGRVRGVIFKDGGSMECDSVILATGGLSYPRTGSTGDGYKMAMEIGHSLVEPKPSLVPLTVAENWVNDLEGLSLRNIAIKMLDHKNEKVYEDFGEMVFTGWGVSGPVILSSSRHILDYGYKDIRLQIDLKPALSEAKLDSRIQGDFNKYSRKQFKNSLEDLLPKKIIPVIIMLSGISPDKFVNQITREERRNLINLLKKLEFNITGPRPVEEAIVTAGGIPTNEIHPSTMESRIIKGLYFAGEIIDTDGYTGGFNLTIAFSTGYLSGSNC